MHRSLCCFLALALTACGPLFQRGADGGDPGTSQSPVTGWPTFSGDCGAPWNHTVKVMNSNPVGDTVTFSISDTVEGVQGFQAWLSMTFDPALVGVPLALDQSAAQHVKIDYIVINTTYQPYGDPGMIQGTVTVKKYQPPDAAEFLFTSATLVGHDSVYSGTYRCGINGTLTTGFVTTALGARCSTDLECGGARSGRVCDNATFVCAAGCHVAEDCPLGKTCEFASAACR